MTLLGAASTIPNDPVMAVLYGGASDGQHVTVGFETQQLEVDGTVYHRDPDPRRQGEPRFIVEGLSVYEHGGLAERLASARERAAGDTRRTLLAIAPLIAEAYAFGVRIARDSRGVLQVFEPSERAPEPGEHQGLIEMFAARLRGRQSKAAACVTLLVWNMDVVREGADAGLFDLEGALHGVVDLDRGRIWPFLPALWRQACGGCGYPVTDLYADSARTSHQQCGAR